VQTAESAPDAPALPEPLGNAGGLSIFEALEDFLLTKNSLGTRRTYAGTLTGFFRHADVLEMRELHPRLLPPGEISRLAREYLDTLTKRHKEDANRILNPRTVNNKAAALSSFFRWLCEVHGYPHNPIQPIHKPHKTPKYSNTESLSRGEIVDLLKHAEASAREREKNFRDYLILLFAFGLALRRAEIARLRWDDIGTQSNLPVVSIYRKGGKPEIQPLPSKLVSLLDAFREHSPTTSPYIFRPVRNRATGDLEKPMSTDAVFDVIRAKASELFPGKNITPHSLRKTFIELALSEGEDFHAIMNATGLARVEMVRYYDGRDQVENNAMEEAFPAIPDDIDIVFDLAGSISEHSHSITSALTQADFVIIPVWNEVKALNATVGTIQEVARFTSNILVVATKLQKGRKEKLPNGDWSHSEAFLNIKQVVDARAPFPIPVLPLKFSAAFDAIFEHEKSIHQLMADDPLAAYNYREVSRQFDEIFNYIDKVRIDAEQEQLKRA